MATNTTRELYEILVTTAGSKSTIDALNAATKASTESIRKLKEEAKLAGTTLSTTTTKGAKDATSAFKQMERAPRNAALAFNNASYQVQDFFIQVGNGTSAMRAFSQQAPQLLTAFGTAGGPIGVFLGVLATVISVLPVVMKTFDETEDATKAFDEAFKDLSESMDDFSSTSTSITKLQKDWNEAVTTGNDLLQQQIADLIRLNALKLAEQGTTIEKEFEAAQGAVDATNVLLQEQIANVDAIKEQLRTLRADQAQAPTADRLIQIDYAINFLHGAEASLAEVQALFDSQQNSLEQIGLQIELNTTDTEAATEAVAALSNEYQIMLDRFAATGAMWSNNLMVGQLAEATTAAERFFLTVSEATNQLGATEGKVDGLQVIVDEITAANAELDVLRGQRREATLSGNVAIEEQIALLISLKQAQIEASGEELINQQREAETAVRDTAAAIQRATDALNAQKAALAELNSTGPVGGPAVGSGADQAAVLAENIRVAQDEIDNANEKFEEQRAILDVIVKIISDMNDGLANSGELGGALQGQLASAANVALTLLARVNAIMRAGAQVDVDAALDRRMNSDAAAPEQAVIIADLEAYRIAQAEAAKATGGSAGAAEKLTDAQKLLNQAIEDGRTETEQAAFDLAALTAAFEEYKSSLTTEEIRLIQVEMERLRNVGKELSPVFETMRGTLDSVWASMIEGTIKGKDAFEAMLVGILQDIAKFLVSQQIKSLLNLFTSSAWGTGFNNALNTPVAPGPAMITSSYSIPATSGLSPEQLAGSPIPRNVLPATYASGPPNKGDSGGMTVNITNTVSDTTQVETKERENGMGGRTLEVIITKKIVEAINGGALDKTMSSVYGVRRRPG